MTPPQPMLPANSLLGAPVPSRHDSPDDVPTAGGVAPGGEGNQGTRGPAPARGGKPGATRGGGGPRRGDGRGESHACPGRRNHFRIPFGFRHCVYRRGLCR